MRSVETEGGSIDEAIDRALEALHMTREQVAIEILENASRGLFGLGSKRARVRATVRGSVGAGDGDTPGGALESVSRETTSDPTVTVTPRGVADRARNVLEAILSRLVDSPRVEASHEQPGSIQLSLSGSDEGMIIGRRGQTLDALEHLVNRIVFRDESEHALRIALDVEGYRQRRQESLEQLARRLAAKARETGRPVMLNPMSPRDRRIVHLTLQSDSEVTTASEGEGHYRRLVIFPQQSGRRSRAGARSH